MRDKHYATGRRKEAVARVWITPGSGKFSINERSLDHYFMRESLKMVIQQPLEVTENVNQWDIQATVVGGGKAGQAGAVLHGLSRALMKARPELRPALKRAGFVTRDDRRVERKKYGQPGARKRFQFSKR